MDFARRQAYFGLFDGYHCYGPLENHLPNATCHGHDDEVPNILCWTKNVVKGCVI